MPQTLRPRCCTRGSGSKRGDGQRGPILLERMTARSKGAARKATSEATSRRYPTVCRGVPQCASVAAHGIATRVLPRRLLHWPFHA
jgi:hypothetical protein